MVHIFILNPAATHQRYADDIRERLDKIENIKYFVFESREAKQEGQLVRKILHFFNDEEKIRFYCCGGSGSLCNIINGIDDFSKVEIAYFPCGSSNLFLKSFGEDEKFFYRIENLIYGEAVPIDYIKGNHGCAINSLSVGIDAMVINNIEYYKEFLGISKRLPLWLAIFKVAIFNRAAEYEITIDMEKISGKFMEVYLGNGCAVGKNLYVTDKAYITDGFANYVICPNRRGFDFISTINGLKKKKFVDIRKKVVLGECKKISIRRLDGKPISINLDGELQELQDEWEVEIVRKGLNFVIPKGVTVCDRNY